mgnify:CR=1 FL=1
MQTTNNLEKRIKKLEEDKGKAPGGFSLSERIERYKEIIEKGDFDSEEGRRLKATIDKYADVLAELE